MDVHIVMARCARNKQGFGIRFEQRGRGHWVATWAFAIETSVAHREKYDRNQISGSFEFDPAYPGCPHCGSISIFKCGNCGRIACWDGESRVVTCPWCGNSGTLEGTIQSMGAGQDR